MGEWKTFYYTDGTSALKAPQPAFGNRPIKFTAFPGSLERPAEKLPQHANANRPHRFAASRFVWDVLYSSEMYCSLKLEDFKGCAYGVFTQKGIAALCVGAALIGGISLALGA